MRPSQNPTSSFSWQMIMAGVIQDTMGMIPSSLHTWTGWLVQVSISIGFMLLHQFAHPHVAVASQAGILTGMVSTQPMLA